MSAWDAKPCGHMEGTSVGSWNEATIARTWHYMACMPWRVSHAYGLCICFRHLCLRTARPGRPWQRVPDPGKRMQKLSPPWIQLILAQYLWKSLSVEQRGPFGDWVVGEERLLKYVPSLSRHGAWCRPRIRISV